MMSKLLNAVEKLVDQEYLLASKQHGEKFGSSHEAYAVMLEEKEEAELEFSQIDLQLKWFWQKTKRDNPDTTSQLMSIKESAIRAACECIQVAAMAQKAQFNSEIG